MVRAALIAESCRTGDGDTCLGLSLGWLVLDHSMRQNVLMMNRQRKERGYKNRKRLTFNETFLVGGAGKLSKVPNDINRCHCTLSSPTTSASPVLYDNDYIEIHLASRRSGPS